MDAISTKMIKFCVQFYHEDVGGPSSRTVWTSSSPYLSLAPSPPCAILGTAPCPMVPVPPAWARLLLRALRIQSRQLYSAPPHRCTPLENSSPTSSQQSQPAGRAPDVLGPPQRGHAQKTSTARDSATPSSSNVRCLPAAPSRFFPTSPKCSHKLN